MTRMMESYFVDVLHEAMKRMDMVLRHTACFAGDKDSSMYYMHLA